jgi:hypothetical protein
LKEKDKLKRSNVIYEGIYQSTNSTTTNIILSGVIEYESDTKAILQIHQNDIAFSLDEIAEIKFENTNIT